MKAKQPPACTTPVPTPGAPSTTEQTRVWPDPGPATQTPERRHEGPLPAHAVANQLNSTNKAAGCPAQHTQQYLGVTLGRASSIERLNQYNNRQYAGQAPPQQAHAAQMMQTVDSKTVTVICKHSNLCRPSCYVLLTRPCWRHLHAVCLPIKK
jgi:hypothetical protein